MLKKLESMSRTENVSTTRLLCMLLTAHSKEEVAAMLDVSAKTVQYHMDKLGVRIVRVAIPRGHRVVVKRHRAEDRPCLPCRRGMHPYCQGDTVTPRCECQCPPPQPILHTSYAGKY